MTLLLISPWRIDTICAGCTQSFEICFGSALPFPGDMHSLDASFIVTNYVVTLQASIIALG